MSIFKTVSHPSQSIRNISAASVFANSGFTSTVESDSHANSFVAGKNCIPLHCTERSCNVQPCSDDRAPVKNVPVIAAATEHTSANGLNRIRLFPEAPHLPNLGHSLFNPNQLRHFGTKVQDNPCDSKPMSVTTRDDAFAACLQSKGTDIFLTTWALTSLDMERCPHVTLCASHPWNPREIRFPGISSLEQEEIEVRNIGALATAEHEVELKQVQEEDLRLDVSQFRDRTVSSARIAHDDMDQKNQQSRIHEIQRKELPPIIPGPLEEHELTPPHTFLSKDRHSNTAPEDLSEKWGLRVAQAALTLKASTRRLIQSALMPLARRCRMDRMFSANRLEGTFATDAMDMRCRSIHGEKFCQVFANKEFFAAAHPVKRKANAHEPLDLFVNECGAMEPLICDGAEEQVGKFSQVDGDGHRHVIFDAIIGHRTDGTEVIDPDAFIRSANGVKRRTETTRGWEINVQWKDGSTTWHKLKDAKDSYLLDVAEHTVENGISERPSFKWWIPFVLKKRDRIISKTKSSCWTRTHKHGIEIPKNHVDGSVPN
jgi:hypothetical protein